MTRRLIAPSMLVLLWFLCVTVAVAQPQIAYILPDIGSPRFSTYVEVIAPATARGTFGADRVWLNNAGDDVRLVLDRPADSARITFGPLVVSWDGRIIATHAFVHPTVQPNSSDWEALRTEFRIPIKVVVNGRASNIDTFYIVKPWTLGNVTADPGRILGEGTLGKRSRRGAMIVDSLILPGGETYTASLRDPDSRAPGNQAYLPFTLLSPSTIRGVGTVDISVSASGANGGPGGGGGAGEYENSLATTGGTDGGAGYTGGGPGGVNSTFGNRRQKPGLGSGEDVPRDNANTRGSKSLSGIPGGESTGAYENAGGGTGHPFGQSGTGCDNRNACSPVGGNGGGSGSQESKRGGGGGYGEDGGDETGTTNGGIAHGNIVLVPLAGGSGGAGGNPDLFNRASGGGGGGGAVSIHANFLSSLNISARGALPARRTVLGGGGSGGGVIAGGRLDNPRPTDAVTWQISGASDANPNPAARMMSGGRGRARYDGAVPLNLNVMVGPMTDTSTNALRTHLLTGQGNGNDLQIYIKPESGPWQLGPRVSGYRINESGFWRQQITWPGRDTLYYIAVGLAVPTTGAGEYTAIPEMIFSQSAWNIIRIYGPPIINGAQSLDLGAYVCPGEELRDTVWVKNVGESPLVISQSTFTGAAGFRLVAPVLSDTIKPFDSTAYVVAFTPVAGQSGNITAQLQLQHNDTAATSARPFIVNLRVDVRPYDFTYAYGTPSVKRDTVDLGIVCIGREVSTSVIIANPSASAMRIERIVSTSPALVTIRGGAPSDLSAGTGSAAFLATFLGRARGVFVIPVLIYTAECPRPDTVWVRGDVRESNLTLIGTGQFGVVRVGDRPELTIELRNDGSDNARVSALPTIPAGVPFRVVRVVPALPAVLVPGASMFITYAFEPLADGDHAYTLRLGTDSVNGSCPATIVTILAGSARGASITLSQPSISFDTVSSCAVGTDSVVVTNSGSVPLTLFYPASINGLDQASFRIVRQPLNDLELAPGASASFGVVMNGSIGPDGSKSAILTIRTSDPQLNALNIPLAGYRASANLAGPRVVDLGLIEVGTQGQAQRSYTNASALATAGTLALTPGSTSTTVAPPTFSVASGDSVAVTFTVQARNDGAIEDTVLMVLTQPCADTVVVLVRALGFSRSISAAALLDMGVVAECATTRDSIVYTNTQAVPLTLLSASVTGPDASLFILENAAALAGQVLQPGASIALYVRFDPRSSTDGRKQANVVVTASIGGGDLTVITELKGERRMLLATAPDRVVFGTISVGNTTSQRVTVQNVGGQAANIARIALQGTSGGVFTITPSQQAPFRLERTTFIDVDVVFTPGVQQTYVDTLLVTFDAPCNDTRRIPISGVGQLNIEILLEMPIDTVDPATRNYALPITARRASGDQNLTGGTLILRLQYATEVFVARSVDGGTIRSNTSTAGTTDLEIVVPGINVTDSRQVLTSIVGDMTLGTVGSTALRVVDARIETPAFAPIVRPIDGSLTLAICREGGDRFVTRAGALAMRVLPNPSVDVAEVVADVFEQGMHTITIMSITGERIDAWSFMHTRGDASHRSLRDVRQWAPGVYSVVLETPTRRRVAPLTILR